MSILIDHDYYVVELNRDPSEEVFNWLHEQFGDGDGEHWFYRQKKLYFASSKDHLMFVLRYSE